MVQAVVGQLMISSNDDEDDDPVKKANLVFPVLESWYDNQYPKGQRHRPSGSPVKKRARKSGSDEDEAPPPQKRKQDEENLDEVRAKVPGLPSQVV